MDLVCVVSSVRLPHVSPCCTLRVSRLTLTRPSCCCEISAGDVVTGAIAVRLSDMTGGAAAVIPEVLAGQVLSLARRGGGRTVLPAGGAGDAARDRLVVTLQPSLLEVPNSAHDTGGRRKVEGSSKKSTRDGGDDIEKSKQKVGNNDRPRHALVVLCAPGQVSSYNGWIGLF